MPKFARLATHVVIPDTQIRPDVPTVQLEWIGRYLVDEFAGRPNVTVVHLGDHWDMPSLSSYDRGKASMEGRRYKADIEAGNVAFAKLTEKLELHNARRRNKWRPRLVFLYGNHENRISRAAEDNAQLDGLVSLDACQTGAWETVPFEQPLQIDGVHYCHYFYNPMTGKPYGGQNIETRLQTIGHTFTMGHQQTLKHAVRYVGGKAQHGLVAGACYLHDEDYLGPQGNAHWRGIVVKHQVEDGDYDIMPVRLDYLARRYSGRRFADWRRELAA